MTSSPQLGHRLHPGRHFPRARLFVVGRAAAFVVGSCMPSPAPAIALRCCSLSWWRARDGRPKSGKLVRQRNEMIHVTRTERSAAHACRRTHHNTPPLLGRIESSWRHATRAPDRKALRLLCRRAVAVRHHASDLRGASRPRRHQKWPGVASRHTPHTRLLPHLPSHLLARELLFLGKEDGKVGCSLVSRS